MGEARVPRTVLAAEGGKGRQGRLSTGSMMLRATQEGEPAQTAVWASGSKGTATQGVSGGPAEWARTDQGRLTACRQLWGSRSHCGATVRKVSSHPTPQQDVSKGWPVLSEQQGTGLTSRAAAPCPQGVWKLNFFFFLFLVQHESTNPVGDPGPCPVAVLGHLYTDDPGRSKSGRHHTYVGDSGEPLGQVVEGAMYVEPSDVEPMKAAQALPEHQHSPQQRLPLLLRQGSHLPVHPAPGS